MFKQIGIFRPFLKFSMYLFIKAEKLFHILNYFLVSKKLNQKREKLDYGYFS
jgi:hypothetical protein